MSIERYKRGLATPRVVHLCPLGLGGLMGVSQFWLESYNYLSIDYNIV